MGEPSRIAQTLDSAVQGEPRAAAALLPLVYDELRALAAAWMTRLRPGQTLQPTGLVHEAYMRLIAPTDPGWSGRAHFFGAAARAMRQIMVDEARRRGAAKRGGGRHRERMTPVDPPVPLAMPDGDMLAMDQALDRLERLDPRSHQVVMLRFFGGRTNAEIGQFLDLSERTVEREWTYARAWLRRELDAMSDGKEPCP
jgi:RNA polymerase sigma factor (TIGR02999 family)